MMKDAYMSIELGQLKSILDTARNLQNEKIKTPETLRSLIIAYDKIVQKLNYPTELPIISPFDESKDIGWTGYTESGYKKITNLITYIEGYVNAHTPIPPTLNKVEGWNKTIVITIISIIVTALIAIGIYAANQAYQIGVSNGKSETQRGYDVEKISLSKKNDSLKTQYNIISDSLKLCNVNLIEKKDSISLLIDQSKQAMKNSCKVGSLK